MSARLDAPKGPPLKISMPTPATNAHTTPGLAPYTSAPMTTINNTSSGLTPAIFMRAAAVDCSKQSSSSNGTIR
nr:hypothetical protein [Caldilinea sp.]